MKKEEEKVYNALMLDNLTVPDLVHTVSQHEISYCLTTITAHLTMLFWNRIFAVSHKTLQSSIYL